MSADEQIAIALTARQWAVVNTLIAKGVQDMGMDDQLRNIDGWLRDDEMKGFMKMMNFITTDPRVVAAGKTLQHDCAFRELLAEDDAP